MSKKIRKNSSKPDAPEAARTATAGRAKSARNADPSSSLAASEKSKSGSAKSRPESQGTDLAEGSRAPSFNLPREDGTRVSLADFAGRRLVIFFYPRAGTPGCTREAMDFTRLAKEFAACGTTVLGVSADPVKTQDSFRTKHKLSIPLISDEKHDMLEAYGAWGEKSMYGRVFLGILRSTVLVNADGRIARIWRRVKVDGHAEEVLAAARDL
ncbi:alkyl hydroperoxide reductase/ Thiol specific antioxidant/ Mal allergen [Nitrobacter hamburgensis X14]|uniref:thioredoxin-dependent peroxiredoxin n=1 Tax=Nitrobacter hamburgensis (strain DSM 10229 / NCIMB 13809 / X14) TaxID=323097 RepID=Q1QKX1_NITHX|nr:peroxiredoxin [Nitrobacter hamburgensis]ABE63126.1 alkyl hydroperoxide reductase/ Thiol specific antioxidant/ Mal allergen [Nitrobacter hamburgensis X14]